MQTESDVLTDGSREGTRGRRTADAIPLTPPLYVRLYAAVKRTTHRFFGCVHRGSYIQTGDMGPMNDALQGTDLR